MRVIVTGANGQLGYDICRRLSERGIENKGVDIEDFDITDMAATGMYVEKYRPTHIVHCAAYTAVDKAESEKELCERVNVRGADSLMRAAMDVDAELMCFSTDYVFDGVSKDTPWEVDDPKNPINHYGKTKYEGEMAVGLWEKSYILRISWVFGINGANFVKTMLRLAKTRDEISVVDDQFGAPTYTFDVAGLACDILASGKYGVYHAPNSGCCSWYEFAKQIFELARVDMKVNPISSAEYPAPAARPKNSRLSLKSLDQAGFARLPEYGDALERYMKELSAMGELK